MATEQPQEKKKGRFEPKTPVNLDPPKDDPISLDYLEKCNGKIHTCHIVFVVVIEELLLHTL